MNLKQDRFRIFKKGIYLSIITLLSFTASAAPEIVEHRVSIPKMTKLADTAAPSLEYSVSKTSGWMGDEAIINYTTKNATRLTVKYGPTGNEAVQPELSGVLIYHFNKPSSEEVYLTAYSETGEKTDAVIQFTYSPPPPDPEITIFNETEVDVPGVGDEIVLEYYTDYATNLYIEDVKQQDVSFGLYKYIATEGGLNEIDFLVEGEQVSLEETYYVEITPSGNSTCLGLRNDGHPSGYYTFDAGTYYCEMTLMGGGLLRLSPADLMGLHKSTDAKEATVERHSDGSITILENTPSSEADVFIHFNLPYTVDSMGLGDLKLHDASIAQSVITADSTPGIDLMGETFLYALYKQRWTATYFQDDYADADDVAYGSMEERSPFFSSIDRTSKSGLGAVHSRGPTQIHSLYDDANRFNTLTIRVVLTDGAEPEQEGVTILKSGYIYVRE